METEPKPNPQTDDSTTSSPSVHLPHRRSHHTPPEHSPAGSSRSSVSSLSHGFTPDRPELDPQPHPYPSHGSPQLDPLPDLPPARPTSPAPAPAPAMNRYVRDETLAVKKTEYGPEDGFVGRSPEDGGRRRRTAAAGGGRRVEKDGLVRKIGLGFRVFEVVFCLVALSVMASDKRKGWALDSYYRYKEFRYSMGVNVVGFAYSVLQACDLAYQFATGNHSNRRHHLRYYFDFAMDQMLTYLLISSGSSAATRVDDWKANWGADKFPELATTSVGLGFAAFVAFAFSSVISGYSLYTATSS